jgi:RNA polymerase sigma-70 factor (ECF subfamily)
VLSPAQERVLLEQARREPLAFRELYRAYFPRVYAYVSYRVACVEDVEDLTAQTFLKAIEELGRFSYRGEGSFAAWLFRIAHNSVSDFYRRGGKAHDGPAPLEAAYELPDQQPSPDDHVIRQQSFAHLRRLVGDLPLRQQEVITLRFFAGLRNKQIAGILGLDERSVAAHLCRGLRELQRRYAQLPEHAFGGVLE